jgi:hypothetical protein
MKAEKNGFWRMRDDGPEAWDEGMGEAFVAALGSAEPGRLVFASGAAALNISADPSMEDLARGRFTRHIPRVSIAEHVVTIRYQRIPLLGWLVYARSQFLSKQPLGQIALNSAVPWELQFAGGVSRLSADLRGLRLCSLDLLGGASEVTLLLSRPAGNAYLYIAGGADKLVVRRPQGTGVRLQIDGSASALVFDEQRFKAIAGAVCLQSPDFDKAADRYDISIAGGASHVRIEMS